MNRNRNGINIFLLITVLLLSIALLMCLFLLLSTNRLPGGRYTGTLDLSDVAASNASLWLGDIGDLDKEGMSGQTILNDMSPISVELELDVSPGSPGKGEYRISVNRESYDKVSSAVYAIVSGELVAILENRLAKADLTTGDDLPVPSEAAEAVLGMPLQEYLMDLSLNFIPSYDELSDMYATSGEYAALNRFLQGLSPRYQGVRTCISTGDSIMFTDLPILFIKKETENDQN